MSTTAQEPGLRDVLVGSDLLRGGALVSLLVVVAGWDLVGAALFLLVLGGTFLPRWLGAPPSLDAAACAAFILGAWAALLDWYEAVEWLDLVMHGLATGLAAALTLERVGALPPWTSALGRAVVVTAVGALLAVVWELGEWAGHTWLDPSIQVGYGDTLGDLAMGVAGSLFAAVLAGRAAREVAER